MKHIICLVFVVLLYAGCEYYDYFEKTIAVEWTVNHYYSDHDIKTERYVKQEKLIDVLKRVDESDKAIFCNGSITFEEGGKYFTETDVAEGFYILPIK